jgi:hypothetical protein
MATLPQRTASEEQSVSRRLTLFVSALVVVFSVGLLLGVAFERDRKPTPLEQPADGSNDDSHGETGDSVVHSGSQHDQTVATG